MNPARNHNPRDGTKPDSPVPDGASPAELPARPSIVPAQLPEVTLPPNVPVPQVRLSDFPGPHLTTSQSATPTPSPSVSVAPESQNVSPANTDQPRSHLRRLFDVSFGEAGFHISVGSALFAGSLGDVWSCAIFSGVGALAVWNRFWDAAAKEGNGSGSWFRQAVRFCGDLVPDKVKQPVRYCAGLVPEWVKRPAQSFASLFTDGLVDFRTFVGVWAFQGGEAFRATMLAGAALAVAAMAAIPGVLTSCGEVAATMVAARKQREQSTGAVQRPNMLMRALTNPPLWFAGAALTLNTVMRDGAATAIVLDDWHRVPALTVLALTTVWAVTEAIFSRKPPSGIAFFGLAGSHALFSVASLTDGLYLRVAAGGFWVVCGIQQGLFMNRERARSSAPESVQSGE